jgi:hypothetical protein
MSRNNLITLAVLTVAFILCLCVFIPSPSIHVGMKLGDPVAYIKAQGGGREGRFTRTHWAASGHTLDWDRAIFIRPGRVFATRYVTCNLATNGTVVSVESGWCWTWRF